MALDHVKACHIMLQLGYLPTSPPWLPKLVILQAVLIILTIQYVKGMVSNPRIMANLDLKMSCVSSQLQSLAIGNGAPKVILCLPAILGRG